MNVNVDGLPVRQGRAAAVGNKTEKAETNEENKKWTGAFGDPPACLKLLNLFSWRTFVHYCTSNGRVVFHLVETLGNCRLFFIFPRTRPKIRFCDKEIREGWRGRWEEEQRGVMDERERWEATRRPWSVCEFLIERRRRTLSPSYKRRTRVCLCEVQSRTSRQRNRTNTQHRTSHILDILFNGKFWLRRWVGLPVINDALAESWQAPLSIHQ